MIQIITPLPRTKRFYNLTSQLTLLHFDEFLNHVKIQFRVLKNGHSCLFLYVPFENRCHLLYPLITGETLPPNVTITILRLRLIIHPLYFVDVPWLLVFFCFPFLHLFPAAEFHAASKNCELNFVVMMSRVDLELPDFPTLQFVFSGALYIFFLGIFDVVERQTTSTISLHVSDVIPLRKDFDSLTCFIVCNSGSFNRTPSHNFTRAQIEKVPAVQL